MQAYEDLELPSRRHPITRPSKIQIDRELEVFGKIMDNQFQLPVLGWRFGLNAIIDAANDREPSFGIQIEVTC